MKTEACSVLFIMVKQCFVNICGWTDKRFKSKAQRRREWDSASVCKITWKNTNSFLNRNILFCEHYVSRGYCLQGLSLETELGEEPHWMSMKEREKSIFQPAPRGIDLALCMKLTHGLSFQRKKIQFWQMKQPFHTAPGGLFNTIRFHTHQHPMWTNINLYQRAFSL